MNEHEWLLIPQEVVVICPECGLKLGPFRNLDDISIAAYNHGDECPAGEQGEADR